MCARVEFADAPRRRTRHGDDRCWATPWRRRGALAGGELIRRRGRRTRRPARGAQLHGRRWRSGHYLQRVLSGTPNWQRGLDHLLLPPRPLQRLHVEPVHQLRPRLGTMQPRAEGGSVGAAGHGIPPSRGASAAAGRRHCAAEERQFGHGAPHSYVSVWHSHGVMQLLHAGGS
jgi:hypothetical protein